MKKIFLLLVAWVSFPYALWAADMQHAEDLYRQGHYASALGEYEQLLQDYPNDPNLYYNIGNCYFKMGSKGLAVANYYRAWRLAPRDADIRHNLALALQNSSERFVPAGMPEVLHKVFFSLTDAELEGLLFSVFWLFCIVGTIWLLKRQLTKTACVIGVVLLLLTGWYIWRVQLDQQPLAVVASPLAELRSGPGANFPASAKVAQGHLLLLQDSRDKWIEVIVKSQGIKGWIEESSLEKI